MLDGGIARARADEMSDGIAQFTKLLELRLDDLELLFGSCSDGAARGARTCPKRQQLFRLVQREAELSRMPHEPKASHGLVAAATVAATRPARLRENADALIVADGLDVDPCALRQRANREGLVAHAQSMGA